MEFISSKAILITGILIFLSSTIIYIYYKRQYKKFIDKNENIASKKVLE
tara:strand:- start:735 stop:881 length:147 start_codon:yes stop_codon:yes gene_type:complete